MNYTHRIPCLAIAASFLLTPFAAVGGEKSYKEPAEPDRWELRLSLPAWAAGVEGDTGVNGNSAHQSLGFLELAPHLDMALSARFELRKGRFGIFGEYSYLSLSDGIGASDRVIKKLDGREDEHLADLGLSWRILSGERGYLEIIAGARYVNIYTEATIQGNDERIEEVSERLARAGTVARAVLRRELRELSGSDSNIPGPRLASATPEEAARAVGRIRGTTEQRQERIERRLKRDLNRRIASLEDWVDPFVGLRARYNFNDKYYLTGRADIGGFGVGADFSWHVNAGIGCQLSPSLFLEVTYRALGMDYDKNGYIYDMVTHGPEISLGKIF
jgi:hypothetical protein